MQLSEFVKGCLEQHYNAMVRSVSGLSEGGTGLDAHP